MITVEGKYTSAKVFVSEDTDIEKHSIAQIKLLCDTKACEGNEIVVMPDVHPGKIGPIGLVMNLNNKIIMPGLIGPDIGCGISWVKLSHVKKDQLNSLLVHMLELFNNNKVDKYAVELIDDLYIDELFCKDKLKNKDKFYSSFGTLGGGNHFVEVDRDEEHDCYFLVVHSGSRILGQSIYEYYMNRGQEELKTKGIEVPYEMTYLTGELAYQYVYDNMTATSFAELNRYQIITNILKKSKKILGVRNMTEDKVESCMHNYIEPLDIFSIGSDNKIDLKDVPLVLRKGAISAYKDDIVLIPANMKDGSIIGVGKENKEWLRSAPHGSGRIIPRSDVRNHYTVNQFKKDMSGICCIADSGTLDEGPIAYRSIDYLIKAVEPTVDITNKLTPIFNYKMGD